MTKLSDETRSQIRGYVERIEDAEADKTRAGESIKEEYAAAAAAGFDKKALRHLLKRRKADMSKSVALRATVDLYMSALASFDDTELGQWAKAWETEQRQMSRASEPRATAYAEAGAKRTPPRSDLN